MNKSSLKTFAANARKELLKKIEAKAMKIGISEKANKKVDIESSDAIFIDGKQLSKEEKNQRDKLIERINQIGFNQVIEEVAYTWFNRFTALRFMEVNEYLPTGVRVLSSSNPNNADPDMISEALELDLDIDKEFVYDLKLNNKTEELFKYLIIRHCNSLNTYLPFMFEKIDDYTEILFPEGLLARDSFIREMTDIDVIPEDQWRKVEVIGWLYQYYISEEKDRVIQAKKKYKMEEIPFATQLFTPDWIVRYMVQNSLGRYWVESHPEHNDLIGDWDLYLEDPEQKSDFEEKLAPYVNKELRVEDIKCLDPAMGSGHILVYMFDVLYEIYSKCGYMEREIPRLIIENNLFGLEIDDRAFQLACFSVVMKALEYNNRFFRSIDREGLQLNLASIQETNSFQEEEIIYLSGENSGVNFELTKEFIEQFKDAKTLGSLIKVDFFNKEFLTMRFEKIQNSPATDLFEEETRKKILALLPILIKQAEIMKGTYHILVTNPPYMGSKYMNPVLIDYINEHYQESKADLFVAFMDLCMKKVTPSGQLGFLTPFVWMFISSYENFREKIVKQKTISSLIQLEYNAFPEACVPVACFTLRNDQNPIQGVYIKLSEFKGNDIQQIKVLEAIHNPDVDYRYVTGMERYQFIPKHILAYWAFDSLIEVFKNSNRLDQYCDVKKGMSTANDHYYLKLWYEVNIHKSGIFGYEDSKKWFPVTKGGGYRRWYGNNEYVVNWEHNGAELLNDKKAYIRSKDYYFKGFLTWSYISSSNISFRVQDEKYLSTAAGPMIYFENETEKLFYLGFLNTNVCQYMINLIGGETLTYEIGEVSSLPIIDDITNTEKDQIVSLVKQNIDLCKLDWDSRETSWEYIKHPFLVQPTQTRSLKTIAENWQKQVNLNMNLLQENEQKMNRFFIEKYGLTDGLQSGVKRESLSIKEVNPSESVKEFISYAVGCMLGRYSLEEEGLIYAGGEFQADRYTTFSADRDNILPILPGAYFEDDIVSRLIEFVRLTFGDQLLNENFEFIADSLEKKKGETAKETIRRYFLNDFFKDHIQMYKKRPIYWLFTSGKQKAFNCIIYMHRYDKTTLSRIRTDYLHEYQLRIETERKSLTNTIEGDYTAKEISSAKKELKALDKKIEELKAYDELLHHMADQQIEIDLDDGVDINYAKFKGLVVKI
jgi:hypothetical protein